MLYVKQICLVIYLIILILFTVGYASQPIVETSQLTSTNPDGTSNNTSNNKVSTSFYINKYSSIISNAQTTYSGDNDYSNMNNNVNIIFQSLLYACILISISIFAGVVISYFGFKLISKIIFLVAMILMICVFVVIQIIILANSIITDYKSSGTLNLNNLESINTSNGTGYYLILVSTILMCVNYIVYVFLA